MSLSNKVLTTLTYLQSLMGTDEEVVFAIKKDKVQYTIGDYSITLQEAQLPTVNPLMYLIENVLERICTDCLKEDYNFKDPFFIDLTKAYIQALVHQYGTRVPITRTLAKAILQHKLHDGMVWFTFGPMGDVYSPVMSHESDFLKVDQRYNRIIFFLQV